MAHRLNHLFFLLLALFCPSYGYSEGSDRTLSPYFLVKTTAQEGIEVMPLKSTSADVKIVGVIADVKVTQVYKNDGTVPIEAIYVFPGSTRAAVYGMQMTIGDRVRVAKVKEREEAKKTYEEAKAEGKSASLLEQHRPNVFQMNVSNIMPKDEVKVELWYTELLVPTDGVYEFAYPTVVGPRYSNQKEEAALESENWIKNPFLCDSEPAPYSFNLNVLVAGSMPIQDLVSTSHLIESKFESPSRARVTLAESEHEYGNKDFILRYRLEGEKIQTGLLLTESEGEKFFLLMAQPSKRVTPEEIPPRDYLFIVDVSGSMIGFPLDVAKRLMHDLFTTLRPSDSFNLLLFSGGSELLSPTPLPATPENIQLATALLDSNKGGGGTELLPAMRRALKLPSREGVSRSIVIATDGYVQVEKELLQLIGASLNQVNVFALGVGTAVNRYLIEGMAHAGLGEPFFVTNAAEAKTVVPRLKEYIESPVLTDVSAQFEGIETYDVEPIALPDLFAERPLILYGKWRGAAEGKVVVRGRQGTGEFVSEVPVSDAEISIDNSALRYLWARSRIQRLSDYSKTGPSEELTKEITKLGLTYNLLTQYTSFIAVDDMIRNTTGTQQSVKQPLPLPEGVSNSAVGEWGQIGTGPEPETWALISVVSAVLLLLAARRIREVGIWK